MVIIINSNSVQKAQQNAAYYDNDTNTLLSMWFTWFNYFFNVFFPDCLTDHNNTEKNNWSTYIDNMVQKSKQQKWEGHGNRKCHKDTRDQHRMPPLLGGDCWCEVVLQLYYQSVGP